MILVLYYLSNNNVYIMFIMFISLEKNTDCKKYFLTAFFFNDQRIKNQQYGML